PFDLRPFHVGLTAPAAARRRPPPHKLAFVYRWGAVMERQCRCRAGVRRIGVRLPLGGGNGTPVPLRRRCSSNWRSFTAGGRKRNASCGSGAVDRSAVVEPAAGSAGAGGEEPGQDRERDLRRGAG